MQENTQVLTRQEFKDTIKDLKIFIEDGFRALDKKTDFIESKLDHVETRLSGVENRLGNVENRLNRVEIKLDNYIAKHDQRLDIVEH